MICYHTEGPGHDCDWVDKRNALVEKAEEIARFEVPQGDGRRAAYGRAFSRAIQQLCGDVLFPDPVRRIGDRIVGRPMIVSVACAIDDCPYPAGIPGCSGGLCRQHTRLTDG